MVDALTDGEIAQTEVAALIGLNTDLRREYIADCAGGVKRWNRILEQAGLPQRLYLPHVAFNRKVGAFAPIEATPAGERLSAGEWEARKGQWLPTEHRQDVRAVAHAAGLRARQDRGLGRTAPQRDQRPAVRLRLRPSVLSRTARNYEHV